MNAPPKPLPLGLTLLIVLTLLLSSALVARPVSAASIVVNSNADIFSDDGQCTLREAIYNANNGIQLYSSAGECAAGSHGADTITFANNYIITLNSEYKQLDISSELIITGTGSAYTIIQASECNPVTLEPSGCTPATYGVLEVKASGNLTLEGVTVRHGNRYSGGGIENWGTLLVNESIISGNFGEAGGGGIVNQNKKNVTIFNSTLSGNKGYLGGAIWNWGNFHISNSTLSENQAISDGGAIWNVYSMSISNSTLYGNIATGIGGGIFNQSGGGGSLKYINTIIAYSTNGDCVNNATIHADSTHNLVSDGSCYLATNLSGDPKLSPLADNGGPTLTHALLPGSPAIDAGFDIHCQDFDQRGVPRPQGAGCDIGAYELETLVVTNASNDLVGSLREAIAFISPGGRITFSPSLSGKTINLSSTLVIEKNLSIDGSDLEVPITISGNNSVGVFMIGPLGEVTLDSLNIINGVREFGGGINNLGWLLVVNSTLSGNTAYSGGGIFTLGELWIIDSTFHENDAFFKGGGIYNAGSLFVDKSTFSHNDAELGGAIRNDEGIYSQMTVTDSTFYGNQAAHGGAIDVWGDGPNKISTSSFYGNTAAASGGAIRIWSSLTVENSTLSGNSTDSIGGGFNVQDEGMLTLQHVTLNDNEGSSGGGIYVGNNATLKYINTIIAHSTNGDCVNHGAINTESTHNLVEDGSCPVSDYTNMEGDPKLGPLANNGGQTLTHALIPDSPAIDAASMAYCLSTDQRGFYRPFDGNNDGVPGCDIGAFEFHNFYIFLPLIRH
jgi:CSLREA domain-containing protein